MRWVVYLLVAGLVGAVCLVLGGSWWFALGLAGVMIVAMEAGVRVLLRMFSVVRSGTGGP